MSIKHLTVHRQILIWPACLISVWMLAGCHGGAPHVPADWAQQNCEPLEPSAPALQVILTYGPVLPNHAALRLAGLPADQLFWDPGGGYGENLEPQHPRHNDLILEDPPSLDTYLAYRFGPCADAVIEVFEWPLTDNQFKYFRTILIEGLPPGSPAGSFKSNSMGLACCLSVSDFLHRFATDLMQIRQTYFLPQSLAADLYHQSPRRLIVIRKNGTTVCHTPPQRR